MDDKGYLCLTDFGLAKMLETDEVAKTFAGTPDYMAPEIIINKGYSFPVDWWSLGVLTYEMIIGFTPFFTKKGQQALFTLIRDKPVFFPKKEKHGIQLSKEAEDFIKRCTEKDPTKRINKIEEIIAHPWFADIDSTKMLNKELEAPFVPKLSSNPLDVACFDEEFLVQEAAISHLPIGDIMKINKQNH